MVQDKRHDHEVAVFEFVSRQNYVLWRRRVHAMHQLAQRHGVDEIGAILNEGADLVGGRILLADFKAGNTVAFMQYPLNPSTSAHFAAVLPDQ